MEIGAALWSALLEYRKQQHVELVGEKRRFVLPATPLSCFGSSVFCKRLGVRLPYVAGAMANGIASTELVVAMANAELLAFYGAAGQELPVIRSAIDTIKAGTQQIFGVNLIHNPSETHWEWQLAELLIEKGVDIIEASAFMKITPALVYYRCKGLRRNAAGEVVSQRQIMAKVSRSELAQRFLLPPDPSILAALSEEGHLSKEELECAAELPLADFITIEADSGGHTDNRPALTLFPAMQALARRLQDGFGGAKRSLLGLAGGIATPQAVASAFSMGADYVVTGTINQACIESGSSDRVRKLLADVQQADVVMAPAADMFEMGVEVQVTKKGTMFPMRAKKLFELYRKYPSIDELPAADKQSIEKQIFKMPLDEVWEETKVFFAGRNPAILVKAEQKPKIKMGLIFRWYLGLSSRWANLGSADRQLDYQIWCGPSMGAFNEWSKGSHFEKPEARNVVDLANQLFLVAFLLYRLRILESQGADLEAEMHALNRPIDSSTIATLLLGD